MWLDGVSALARTTGAVVSCAAAAAQRGVTAFVLDSALASAAETLADRQSFQLDQERWEAFVNALDAPPRAHPRLERLLREASLVEQAPGGDAG
jgi:uncharacterized protein (DUF1778 family)